MNPTDIKHHVIEPTLKELGMYSQPAVYLLMGTAAQETNFHHLKQTSGPALGLYQCEPATHRSIWKDYLWYRDSLTNQVRQFASQKYTGKTIDDSELIGNLYYATVICRIHYYRIPEKIPEDVQGLAEYWKKYYNTDQGKGTIDQFIDNYVRYCS